MAASQHTQSAVLADTHNINVLITQSGSGAESQPSSDSCSQYWTFNQQFVFYLPLHRPEALLHCDI